MIAFGVIIPEKFDLTFRRFPTEDRDIHIFVVHQPDGELWYTGTAPLPSLMDTLKSAAWLKPIHLKHVSEAAARYDEYTFQVTATVDELRDVGLLPTGS